MANIPFPNVPNLPGVPPLPRSANFPPTVRVAASLLQGIIWRTLQVSSQWGVFDKNGKPLADPAKFTGLTGGAIEAVGLGSTLSTASVDYSKETRVSSFPIERGSFANFNKVESPATPQVTLRMGGSEANRTAFLEAIDKATKSTDLFSVVTPEKVYVDYSIERYNYRRSNQSGATLLTVELTLQEIRQVSAQYGQSNKGAVTDPKSSNAAPPANNGKVQAKTPDISILKAISKKLPSLSDIANQYAQGILK